MKKMYLYAHGGSGNHGCEAIVRSTFAVLDKVPFEHRVLVSTKPEEDRKYHIDELCELVKEKSGYSKMSFDFLKAYLQLKIKNNYFPLDQLEYKTAFEGVKKGDIAFSIGGDNYCYVDKKRYMLMHDLLLKKGAKTVLWGCSVEPEVIEEPEVAADLAKYSLITARETISYEALKKVNPNTVLVSDSAFMLEKSVKTDLQLNNVVGINVSPMVIDNEAVANITMKNYENLVQYILENTDMGVALIPHVVWNDTDDREPLMALYEKFKETGRVVMIQDCNCMELKGYISQCRFFVGARTHATIAAYSTCVPTLVVGYSVKARGIARDLFGTEENYVLPVQKLDEENALIKAFQVIEQNEVSIKKQLEEIMPAYRSRIQNGVEKVKALLFNDDEK